MSKKSILALTVVGIGALATAAIFTKNDQLSAEDEEKIRESKGYTVSKYNSPINGFNLLSVSSLPTYYKVAKTVAKYVL